MKKILLLAGAMTMLVLSSCEKDKDADASYHIPRTHLDTTILNNIYDGDEYPLTPTTVKSIEI